VKRLIVIDGHNFLWRAYSVPFKFYSKNDTPLHVISTYLSLVRRSIASINDLSRKDSLVIVFDTDTPNGNTELSAAYKANRRKFAADEDSPYAHLPYVKKALSFLRIGYLDIPHIEADDVIASVSRDFCARHVMNKAYIFSTDSDFYQLLDPQTFIVRLKNGQAFEVIDRCYVQKKLGVAPEQYIEYKCLVGDTADNIKGVRGVGPATARKIVCGKIKFDTDAHRDVLELNKKLITLNCGCKKAWRLTDLSYRDDIMNSTNRDIFEDCGF